MLALSKLRASSGSNFYKLGGRLLVDNLLCNLIRRRFQELVGICRGLLHISLLNLVHGLLEIGEGRT